ncbi:MAG TPA: ABC transporter permease, partial [Gemmataceae bacterium]
LWFGCNNAAKEIVKEEAIYGRERAVNLGIVPYLASKFLVLSVITAFHALMLMALVYGTLEALQRFVPGCTAPPPEYCLAYLPQFGVLLLLAMSGVALGLLLSACVSSPDRANALLPYVLIPQLILGGGILDVQHGPLAYLAMALSPVYWAYRGVHLGAGTLPSGFPGHVDHADGLLLPCVVLAIQTMLMLAATGWALRRKEA